MATGVTLTVIAETGGTRHEAYLTVLELEHQTKLQIINLIFWIASTLFGKMAVGLTILRILNKKEKWQTWPVHFVIWFMLVSCVLDTLLLLFRCGSPGNLWDFTRQSACLDTDMVYNYNIFAAAWQVLVDFFLAFFPMYIVWGLRMPARRRYTLVGLLGLTTFTGVAAAVKTSVAQQSLGAGADATWDVFVLAMWAAVEIMLIVACGSVPAIFPLWERFFHRSGSGGGGRRRWQGYRTTGEDVPSGKIVTGSSGKHTDSRGRTQTAEDVDIEMSRLVAAHQKSGQSGARSVSGF